MPNKTKRTLCSRLFFLHVRTTCIDINFLFFFTEEYAQYYGQMNTMNGRMMTMKAPQHDGLPYEEMGYCPPPNRKLPPVPGAHSNYNTIDRIKNGKELLSFVHRVNEAK